MQEMLYYIYRLCLPERKEQAINPQEMRFPIYHNFIFDLYGTLVDIHTNEKKPSPYACPEICAADIFRTLYTEKGIQPTEALLTAAGQFFRIESLNTLQCYPATISTLQQLRSKGCGVYLLSNAQRIFIEYELRSLGLWELFDGILISSDEGCCKPDPAFFRILFDRYGLDPADCLMIGNERTSDLAGALAAGIDCCYLHTATSSGSADEPPEEACFTVMEGDSYALQKLLLSLAKIK